ncbi:MAG: tRNA-dihydrouridine synthase B [Desulforhopalus sp.]|jgi:tRNA-dihydrouridine synthase B
MFQIGPHKLDNPFVLAPLAGYTDLPFRLLCKEFGAGLTVSEMISCHGLVYRQSNTLRMLKSAEDERPVSFQLFGAEPDIMAEAAEIMASLKPDIIDINMGCPVRKVTKRGAGSALMTTPKIAEEIIHKVVSRVNIPVTVKFRSGKDQQHITAVEFAKMVEGAGASAVTVHARTWAQGFSGQINPSVIRDVTQSIKLPVIGNGDVFSLAEGYKMMADTGCHGVMIGRAALGNPWVFSKNGRPDGYREIMDGARRHLNLMQEHLPVEQVMGYIKNHISRYFKGLKGASSFRKKIFDAATADEINSLLANYDLDS